MNRRRMPGSRTPLLSGFRHGLAWCGDSRGRRSVLRTGPVPAPLQPRVRAGACRGFSLLETLIALLVLSIGALGNVALQLHALQVTHSAYQRTLASLIAADAGERLWMAAAGGDDGLGWFGDWVEQRDCAQDDPHVCLPGLEVRITGVGTGRVISVSWAEERFTDAADGRVQLDYAIEVPQEPAS